jgi:hypothetical protein
MKNKKNLLNGLATILVVLSLFSCNQSELEKEKSQKTIDSLENKLDSLRNPFTKGSARLEKVLSEAFPTRNNAKEYADAFRATNSLQIPLSIRFDKDDLLYLANRYPYVRFYFGVQPGTNFLTLMAVGVNNKNQDMDLEIVSQGATTTEIYEFADPCPPCVIGTYPQPTNTLLYPMGAPNYILFDKH